MKITGEVQIESVIDVLCDVCLLYPRVTSGRLQFATL